MKNLKQKFLDTWVKCLSLILSFLGFSACIGDGPDLYGCPTDEYQEILKALFGDNLGEGSYVTAPILGVCFDHIKIGKNVVINSNMLAMARGGITIEDDVQIAANVQLLTNNHDPYERRILPCRPILIKKGAWIGYFKQLSCYQHS